MEEQLQNFNNYLIGKGLNKNTIKSYLYDLNSFQKYLINKGGINYLFVNENIINNFLQEEKLKSNKITSINRKIISLRNFYKFLFKNGKIKKNININYKVIISKKSNEKLLTIEEMKKILSLIDTQEFLGIRNYCIYKLLYTTGIKISELLNLKESDLLFDKKLIDLNNRKLILSNKLIKDLKLYLKIKNTINNKNDFLFISAIGETMTRQAIWSSFKLDCEKLGINNVNLNTLRDSFAYNLIIKGINYNNLKYILGNDPHYLFEKYAEFLPNQNNYLKHIINGWDA